MVYLTEQQIRNAPALLATARGVTPKELASMFDDFTFSPKPIPYGYCQCGCGLPAVHKYADGHQNKRRTQAEWDDQLECYRVSLTRGLYALVDAADLLKVLDAGSWYANPSGKGRFYARTRKPSRYLHRFILDAPAHMLVDHINGDTLDNRRCNLRICTAQENAFNSRGVADRTSAFKGVYWQKGVDKWRARIAVGKSTQHLGYFDSEIDAAKAYDVAAFELHGEFAHLNFPELREVPA